MKDNQDCCVKHHHCVQFPYLLMGAWKIFSQNYIYKFEQFNYLDLVKINLLANEDKRINSEEKYLTTQKILSSEVIHKKFEDLISE